MMSILNLRNPISNINPIQVLSTVSFRKARRYLLRHISLHYFLHNTYCRLSKSFRFITYVDFVIKSIRAIYANSDDYPLTVGDLDE